MSGTFIGPAGEVCATIVIDPADDSVKYAYGCALASVGTTHRVYDVKMDPGGPGAPSVATSRPSGTILSTPGAGARVVLPEDAADPSGRIWRFNVVDFAGALADGTGLISIVIQRMVVPGAQA